MNNEQKAKTVEEIQSAANSLCNYVQPLIRESYVLGFEEGIIWYDDHVKSRIKELERNAISDEKHIKNLEDQLFKYNEIVDKFVNSPRNKTDKYILDMETENKELKEALGVSEPWNVIHVIEKLADATDFLLQHRNYDRTGWEEIAHCVKLGQEYANKIAQALKPKTDESGK